MRCNICYLPIQEERALQACPRCFNDFHRDHLAAWLLKKDYCPMCRETLSDDFREDLKPKTERERLRLERTLKTLDGLGDMFRDLETKEKKTIMRSREAEFGIESAGIGGLVKLVVPLVFFGLSIFVVILAINS